MGNCPYFTSIYPIYPLPSGQVIGTRGMTAALTQGLIETITLSVANVAGKYAQPHMMTLKDLVLVVVRRIEDAEACDNYPQGNS